MHLLGLLSRVSGDEGKEVEKHESTLPDCRNANNEMRSYNLHKKKLPKGVMLIFCSFDCRA